jgi:aromatic ring hydroxylase
MNKPMIASEVSGQASAPVSSSTLDAQPIRTGAEYVESLRNRNLTVYLMGELVGETVDHPIIRPSINAVAATYDLAVQKSAARSFANYRRKQKKCLLSRSNM